MVDRVSYSMHLSNLDRIKSRPSQYPSYVYNKKYSPKLDERKKRINKILSEISENKANIKYLENKVLDCQLQDTLKQDTLKNDNNNINNKSSPNNNSTMESNNNIRINDDEGHIIMQRELAGLRALAAKALKERNKGLRREIQNIKEEKYVPGKRRLSSNVKIENY